jgi:DNA-binding IclR family transcriptional regulator
MAQSPSRKDSTGDEDRVVNNGFSGVDAVERALTLLHAFDAPDASAMTLKALAERSGLTKSTILRLAVSLERFGYLVRDRDVLYHLGPTLWRLGSLFRQRLNLGEVVRPVLERLVDETSESASFYVPRGDKGVCLYRVNSPRLARDHVDEGDVIPFGVGSSGQILKAFSGSKSPTATQIRRDRIYVSHGERDPDVAGISTPVLDPDGELIGAISLSGLATRFTDKKVAGYRAIVSAAAREIEARIGVTTG